MDFDEYSEKAAQTDTTKFTNREKLQFLALGLNEEAGEIARLIKKVMRNDIIVESMENELRRKLGDVLWYLSRFGNAVGIKLSEIAAANIDHTERRWLPTAADLFDLRRMQDLPENERFPEYLLLKIETEENNGQIKIRLMKLNGTQVGDTIDDNAYQNDGYRFHDVIHLAFMVHFRWSPVLRKLLNIKRRSNPETDRVEDGARARDIEEALSILIFAYMRDNNFLENAATVDTSFLKILRSVSQDREISKISERAWELAILDAANIIRQLKKHHEGYVTADNVMHQLSFKPSHE